MKKTNYPLYDQYKEMKYKYPGKVLLARYGDFYECFDDDAFIVHEKMNLPQTEPKKYMDTGSFITGIIFHRLSFLLDILKRYKVPYIVIDFKTNTIEEEN